MAGHHTSYPSLAGKKLDTPMERKKIQQRILNAESRIRQNQKEIRQLYRVIAEANEALEGRTIIATPRDINEEPPKKKTRIVDGRIIRD